MITIKELGKRLAARLDEDDWGYIEPFLNGCDNEIESLRQQLAEANNERTWIRRKLKLPEDTKLLSGEVTLAGTMHNVCNGNHGYRAYIESEKCDDKAGKIARLTVQLAECQATNGKLREALKRLDSVAHISCGSVTEALALPNDSTALNELIAERTKELERMLEFTSEQHRSVLKSHDELTAEVERLKTVPMKYRRMKFNAELQDENAELRQQNAELTAQRDAAMKDAERYRFLRKQSYVAISARKECLWIPRGIFEIP